MRHRLRGVGVHHELVTKRAPEPAVAQLQVFQFKEALQMRPHLRETPAARLAQLAAAKGAFALLCLHERADVAKERPGLRRQFVERAAEHLRGELVRKSNVVEGGLDIFDHAAAHFVTAARALVLVKERNGVDQGKVFLMIAAGAGASAREGEGRCVRIQNLDRRKEPLGVPEDTQEFLALRLGHRPASVLRSL